LGSALLPQSLQGQLQCKDGEKLCVHDKVVWLLASRRCVGVIGLLSGEVHKLTRAVYSIHRTADLPVQTLTNYRLAINLKTVKALGLNVRTRLLALADEVIE
jgi:hypothetical protein